MANYVFDIDELPPLVGQEPVLDFDALPEEMKAKKIPKISVFESTRMKGQQASGEKYDSGSKAWDTGRAVGESMLPFSGKIRNIKSNAELTAADALVGLASPESVSTDGHPPINPAQQYSSVHGDSVSDFDRSLDVMAAKAGIDEEGMRLAEKLSAGDPQKKLEILQSFAKNIISEKAENKQDASARLNSTRQGALGKIGSGFIDNTGYSLEYAVGGAVRLPGVIAGVSSAAERFSNLTTPDWEVDRETGETRKIDNADSAAGAAGKAALGAGFEVGIEIGTDAILGMFGKAGSWAVGKAVGKTGKAVRASSRRAVNEATRSTVRQLSKSKAGRTILTAGKAYNELAEITAIHGMPTEMVEEWLQDPVDNITGLSSKSADYNFDSELKEWGDRFFSKEYHTDLFLGMLGTVAFQGGLASAKTYQAESKQGRSDDGFLRTWGLGEDTIKSLDSKDKQYLRRVFSNPKMTQEKAERMLRSFGSKVNNAVSEIVSQEGYDFDAQQAGIESNFKLPEAPPAAGETYVDPQSGIGLLDYGDGRVRVFNRDGKDSGVFTSVPEAVAEAGQLSRRNQAMDMRREQKETFIRSTAQRLAGDMDVELHNTTADLLAAYPEIEGDADYADGSPGISYGDRIHIVLDNIQTPHDVISTIMHEAGVHSGLRRVMNDSKTREAFLGNLNGEEVEGFKDFMQTLGYTPGSAAEEALAYMYERRLANPSGYQKAVKWIHDTLRAINPAYSFTESDIEVIMADAQKSVRGDGGAVLSPEDFGSQAGAGAEASQQADREVAAARQAEDEANRIQSPSFQDEEAAPYLPPATRGVGSAPAAPKQQAAPEVKQKVPYPGPRPNFHSLQWFLDIGMNAEAAKQAYEGERGQGKTEIFSPAGKIDGGAESAKGVEYEEVTADYDNRNVEVAYDKNGAVFPIYEVPLKNISLSPEVSNFKTGANETTGETDPIQAKKYRRLGTPPIVLWERLNGKLEIITGRHRVALARRTGELTIPAQIMREADGFTREQALILDAESNIIDEKGSVADYAKYIKGSGINKEEADQRGITGRDKGRKGFAIGKYAEDDLYTLFRNEKINSTLAATIAELAPNNSGAQLAGMKYAQTHNAAETAQFMKAMLSSRPAGEQMSQGDMFGTDTSWVEMMNRRAAAAHRIEGRMRGELSALKAALSLTKEKRAEIVSGYGFKSGNPDAIKKRIAELDLQLFRFENWHLNADLAALVAKEAGEPPQKAKEPKAAEPRGKNDGSLFDESEIEFNLGQDTVDDPARLLKEKQEAEAKAEEVRRQEAAAPDLFKSPEAAPSAPATATPVKASQLLPAALAKRLLSLPPERRTSPFGDANKELRRDVIKALTGKSVSSAKAGATAVRTALIEHLGLLEESRSLSPAAVDNRIVEELQKLTGEKSISSTYSTAKATLPTGVVLLAKNGDFFTAYGEDAASISAATGISLKEGMLSIPSSALKSTREALEKAGIVVSVLGEDIAESPRSDKAKSETEIPQSPDGNYQIYKADMRGKDGSTSPRYAVPSRDHKDKRGVGDSLFKTLEEAKAEAENNRQADKADEDFKAKQAEDAAKLADQKAVDENLDGFRAPAPAPRKPPATRPEVKTPLANLSAEKQAKAQALQERLRKLRGRTSLGIDPEYLAVGVELTGLYIEGGVKTFKQYASAMKHDLGDIWGLLKNNLRALWEGAANEYPDIEEVTRSQAAAIISEVDSESEMPDNNNESEVQNDDDSADGFEPDSDQSEAEDMVGDSDVQPEGRGAGRKNSGSRGGRSSRSRDSRNNNSGVSDGTAADDGSLGDSGVPEGEAEIPERSPGDSEPAGGDLFGEDGPSGNDRSGDSEPAGPSAGEAGADQRSMASSDPKVRRKLQRDADQHGIVRGNKANIRKTLPLLMSSQQDDVLFAEERFAKPDGYGVLFTNGTGTGKTYSGMGIIKRYVREGRNNILIVVPGKEVIDGWVKAATDLGVPVEVLGNRSSSGRGVTITTYANMGMNPTLADRKWDLVVADESQFILQKEGSHDVTKAGHVLRAITMHPREAQKRARMVHRDLYQKLKKLFDREESLRRSALNDDRFYDDLRGVAAEIDKIRKEVQLAEADMEKAVAESQGEKRPRVMFLSATPFAYTPNIDYAEGYLFDYPKVESSGWRNQPNPYESYMISNFGYQMRYNRLEAPGANVNSDVMERQWNEMIVKSKVMSGRRIDIDSDYERRFAYTPDKIGTEIDNALSFLRRADRFADLYEFVQSRFTYLSRMYLLESLKARHSVPIIRKWIKQGNKVVVFHDYNQGGGFNPFDFENAPTQMTDRHTGELVKTAELVEEFRSRNPSLASLDFSGLYSPIETIMREFPNAGQINGTRSEANIKADMAKFNDDSSGMSVIIVQAQKGGAGISLHDTTGKHPRREINLGLPGRPTTAIQEEGRIYRVGQKAGSDSMFLYMNTGTNWEAQAFARKMFERGATTENLAMGHMARRLRESYVEGFNESSVYTPTSADGRGGKARDRAQEVISEYEQAKSFYYGRQKKTSKTKSQEGADYFATPEPVGLKMVEWAGVKDGESILEPSSGHGAISRFFSETTKNVIIEPSTRLLVQAQLHGNAQTKAVNDSFENHDLHNKYDAITMNPPFGTGGKLAMEHVAKAFRHLRDGGRIVAIIPQGPSMDKRLDAWMEETKEAVMIRSMSLPAVTFSRAGTSVATRVVVIDRHVSEADRETAAANAATPTTIQANTLNELFDTLEYMKVPERVEPTPSPDKANLKAFMQGGRDAILPSSSVAGTPQITKVFHTKKDMDVFILKTQKAMERDEYLRVNKAAKDAGGWYSKKFGTSPSGFAFETKEAAEEFAAAHPDVFTKAAKPMFRRQIDTPEFKKWFGKSKVGWNGKPKVVYHGTRSDFSIFDKKRIGQQHGKDRIGFFFSDDQWEARGFADGFDPDAGDPSGIVMEVYLKIENPLTEEDVERAGGSEYDYSLYPLGGMYYESNQKIIKKLMNEGNYDGVIIGTLHVVREPSQIKSATGNNGDFDGANPDIRFRRPLSGEDQAYMQAVESGDTDAAQKMVDAAARAAGYTVGPVWHSTAADFNVFDRSKVAEGGANRYGPAFYFTADAREQVHGKPTPRQFPVFLNMGRVLEFDAATETRFPLRLINAKTPAEAQAMLNDMGYDSFRKRFTNDFYAGVYDADRIKSADPVVRDDAGNVIPLSERFTQKSDDIRFRRPTDDLAGLYDPPIERDRKGNPAVGMTKEYVIEERQRLGLDEIEPPQTLSNIAAIDAGMDMLHSVPGVGENLVSSILKAPRALSPKERGLMAVYHLTLSERLNTVEDNISKARSNNNQQDADELVTIRKVITEKLNRWEQASRKSGTEAGRSLQAMQMRLRQDYTLASMVRKARADSGGLLLNDARYEEILQQYKEIKAAYDALQAQMNAESDKKQKIKLGSEFRQQRIKGKTISEDQYRDILGQANDLAEFFDGDWMAVSEMQDIVRKMARYHVGIGLTEVDEVMNAVHADLKDMFPGITPRNVRDIYSRYGKISQLSQEEIDIRMRDLTAQAQKISAIEDVLNKMAPLKTGMQRDEQSQEVRELTRELHRLMKESGITTVDPARQMKTSLDAAKTRMLNEIEDLTKALETGRKIDKATGEILYDEEATVIRRQRDELRAMYNELFSTPMTDEKRLELAITAAERSLQDWQARLELAREGEFSPADKRKGVKPDERLNAVRAARDAVRDEVKRLKEVANPKMSPEERAIRNRERQLQRSIANYTNRLLLGDFAPKPKKEQPVSREIFRLAKILEEKKKKFELARKAWILKNRPMVDRIAHQGYGLLNDSLRAFKTAYDISAVFVQNAWLTAGHLVQAAPAFVKMLQSLSAYKSYKIDKELRSHPDYVEAVTSGLDILNPESDSNAKRPEEFRTGFSERIPGVPASARAFATYSNVLHLAVYSAMKNSGLYGAAGPTSTDKKEIARAVNIFGGRGSLGQKGEAFANAASYILWSFRMQVANIQKILFVPDVILRSKGSAAHKAVLLGQFSRNFAGFSAITLLMRMMFGDDDEDVKSMQNDIFSSLFGQVRIFKTNMEFSGGFFRWISFIAQTLAATRRTMTGKTIDLENTYGESNLDNTFRFVRSKLAPIPGMVANLIDRQNLIGDDYTRKTAEGRKNIAKDFIPIAAGDVVESLQANGAIKGLMLMPFILAGAGKSSYDMDTYAIKVNRFAKTMKKLEEAKTANERTALRRDNPYLGSSKAATIKNLISAVRKTKGGIKKLEASPQTPAIQKRIESEQARMLKLQERVIKMMDEGR